MPFWPFYMLACVCLILWRVDRWFGPAVILAGLIAMRPVMMYAEGHWQQIFACAVWLSAGGLLAYKGLWLSSITGATSGIAYVVLLLFGHKVEYLGLVPIVADALLIAAMLFSVPSNGGGRRVGHTSPNLGRGHLLLAPNQSGVAARAGHAAQDPREN